MCRGSRLPALERQPRRDTSHPLANAEATVDEGGIPEWSNITIPSPQPLPQRPA